MNENQIRIYDSTGSTPINDPDGLLLRAQNILFSTVYPGGIFDDCSFFIPCDPLRYNPIKHNQKISIRNGLTALWEGVITSISIVIAESGSGLDIQANGYWALAMNAIYRYNRWIDRRFSSHVYGVWHVKDDSTAPDKCTYDQNNRLYFVPKAEAWTNGEYAAIQYICNASSNVKRIVFDYDFNEGGQAWELRLYDITNSTALWTVSATGTGSQDITLATSAARLRFEFTAKANQTPTSDGAIYGKITNLACIAEGWDGSSGTTVEYIMQHMVHFLGSRFANADYTYIEANTYDLLSDGFTADELTSTLGRNMITIGTFSATNVSHSVGCLESDAIPSNTLPVVYYETVPALTDYDYAVRLDEPNIVGIELVSSSEFSELYNDVYVPHRDSSGKTQWANYTDDALLRDTDSVTKYGDRVYIVNGGQSATRAGAGVFGRPFVAQNKNLKYYMRGPLKLMGTIRKKNGQRVPVSHLRAGKRIKIENFISDTGDILGSGMTFLINSTRYNDDTGVMSITTGTSDDLATYLARRAVMNDRYL